MVDTTKHVEMVKKRIWKKCRQQTKRSICGLSTLCILLFISVVGVTGRLAGFGQAAIEGMYGSILLHEGAGGYILVAVLAFMLAVVITVLCISSKNRQRRRSEEEKQA